MFDFQFILSLLGLVSFLGAVAVFLRGSADKGTITSLQNSVDALKIENELHEGKISAQEVRLVTLEKENKALREVVTQKREVAALTKLVENHHVQSMAVLEKIEEAILR